MKKGVIIFIIILAAILLTALIVFIDDLRVVEKPLDQVVEIANNKGGIDSTFSPLAYSIERTESKITVTLYGNLEIIKTVHEFAITNGAISSEDITIHFEKKLYAKKYFFDGSYNYIENQKLKGNVIYGNSSSSIGKNADTFVQELEQTYSSFLKKIILK